MKRKYLLVVTLAALTGLTACNNETTQPADTAADTTTAPVTPRVVEEVVSVPVDGSLPANAGVTMKDFVVFDEGVSGKRPAVLVIPEWWGLNDYAKKRARDLSALGYFAMAVDMYGDGKTADNPDSAKKYATPFYADPKMMQERFDAALKKLKTYAQVDTTKIAAIGYCFGGTQVMNLARLGEDLDGVVSFHGNMPGVPLDKSKLKAKMLVCHGGADPFVPETEVRKFKKEMEAAGIEYSFKTYADATHAFTNPEATAAGEKFQLPIKYNAAADSASWQDMKSFLGTVLK